MKNSSIHSVLALLLPLLLVVNVAQATIYNWNVLSSGNASGSWATTGNWSPSGTPGAADTASFATQDITVDSTVTLDGNQSILNLIFGDTATGTAAGWTLNQGSSSTLTLASGSTITVNALGTGKYVTFNAALAGSSPWKLVGPGTLASTTANSISGALTNYTGALSLSGANGALGSVSGITLNNGGLTLNNASSGNNGNRINDSAGITVYGSSSLTFQNDASANNFSETLGAVTLYGGFNVTSSQAASGQTSILTIGSFTRASASYALGTAMFSGAGFGANARNQVAVTTALSSANVNGKIPWAFVNDTAASRIDFAVGGAASAAVTALPSGSYTTDTTDALGHWNANTIIARPSTSFTPTGAGTGSGYDSLDSLVLDNGVNLNAPAANTIIVLGGGTSPIQGTILQTGGTSSIGSGAASFHNQLKISNNGELIIYTAGTLNIYGNKGALTGTSATVFGTSGNAFTKSGSGLLNLANDASINISGYWWLLEGSMTFFANHGAVPIQGATELEFNGLSTMTFQNINAISMSTIPVKIAANVDLVSDKTASGAGVTYTFQNINSINSSTLTVSGGANVNSGTAGITIGGTTLLAGNPTFNVVNPVAANTTTLLTLTGVVSDGGNGYGITKAGNGTLTLSSTNTYSGVTTISAGTLALGASGSLAAGSSVKIAAGGTFDVSAKITYTLGSSATLTASGTGTTAGTTQATIKGGTTVSLGSQGITLTWGGGTSGTDSTHPCLVVSQGALTLNNNAFTVNGTSSLGVGTYTLVSVTGGTINQNGSPSYSVTGSAIDVTKNNVISVSSGSVILTVTAPTKLDFTAVPGSPMAGSAFSVTVTAEDASGTARNVTSDTLVTLSKATGGGTLSGTLTGTIANGSSSVTISTPVYSKSDTMTLTATATSGMSLTTATSGNLTFAPGAVSQLVMDPPTISSAAVGTSVSSSFTSITAEDTFGNVCGSGANDFNGTVTFAGTAGATGTSVAFTHGVLSTFPALSPTVSGSGLTITATSGLVVGTTTITTVGPEAVTDTYSRAPGAGIKIHASDLVANDVVASGYTATFVSCDGTTHNSVTLGTSGSGNSTVIVYPSNAGNTADYFTYTINDGHGGTATGTVNITINSSVTGQATINLAGQTATISFFGYPGDHYVVQRSVNSVNSWADLTSVTTADVVPSGTSVTAGVISAPSGGAFTVTDPSPPVSPTSVFYQLHAAP